MNYFCNTVKITFNLKITFFLFGNENTQNLLWLKNALLSWNNTLTFLCSWKIYNKPQKLLSYGHATVVLN